jgi:2-succinyl-6-hydroxy-2,4-cyclohexadiene-1-carboxylate synthase
VPTANVNGIEIHYRDAGEGFPVVLAHGYTGNSRNWALTVPAVRDQFRTISVDLRGHGLSAKPESEDEYTYPLMAGDVKGLLDHLGIDRCYVVGHSMGGRIAQHLILENPELFDALVLVDTSGETTFARRGELTRLIDFARKHGMEATFEETARTSALTSPTLRANPQFVALWREQFLMTSLAAYCGCGKAALGSDPVLDRLAAVSVPTLVICGENDEPFLDPSRHLHGAIPGSTLAMVPNAGHSPQIETPAEFNRVLTEFLSRVRETSAV